MKRKAFGVPKVTSLLTWSSEGVWLTNGREIPKLNESRQAPFGGMHCCPTLRKIVAQPGEGGRVKYNRVRTRRPHPIGEREWGSQATGRPTAHVVLYCLAATLMGRLALVGLTWVAALCQVCPAALTVEPGAPAVFRQARLAELAWADSNQAD